jgi:hypothetical protein
MTKNKKIMAGNHWKGQIIPKVVKTRKRRLSLKIFDQTVQLTFASIIGVFTAVLLEPYFKFSFSWETVIFGGLITTMIFLYTLLFIGLKHLIIEITRWQRGKKSVIRTSARQVRPLPKIISKNIVREMPNSSFGTGRKWLWKIAVFSLITLLAVFYFFQTFPEVTGIEHPIGGICGGQFPNNDDIWHINSFTLDVDSRANFLDLTFHIGYCQNGNYSVMLTLPYRVAHYEDRSNTTWLVKNSDSGSIFLGIENVTDYSGAGWQSKLLRLSIWSEDPLVVNSFETTTLSLPFGSSLTSDVSNGINNLRGISPIGLSDCPFTGVVSISVPYSATSITATLPIEHRIPTNESQVLFFNIDDFKTFQLQYINPEQRQQFEVNMLIMGILLGVAASGWAELIVQGLGKLLTVKN